MFPKLSNIDANIANTINSYANDNLAASKLNAWIRVYSGANSGLIMQSNTNFKLFAAAGEGNSIYGSADMSGAVGTTWDGTPVTTGVGRALRPSPIITSFNSKEGQDQISRTCEFSITCFSLEQLELMQTYFMEPGYSVGVEWGWNTTNSTKGLIKTRGTSEVLNAIADTTLNNGALSAKRTSTNGEYDIFLGFIVGSTVSNDGENFKVDVKLRGAPSLPTYLQSQNRIEVKSSGITIDPDKTKAPFGDDQLTVENDADRTVADRRFKAMFNALPAFRQTESVKQLKDGTSHVDYINFDVVVAKQISEFQNKNEGSFLPGIFGDTVVQVQVAEGTNVEVSKEKLFSANRYIRFGLAIDILNEMGSVDSYQVGKKKISFKINIENCVIGAFPYMFSTKASKLLIPGIVPNFIEVYFLNPNEVEQQNDGRLKNGAKAWDPRSPGKDTPKFKGAELQFTNVTDLNDYGLKEKALYYGYLKHLFVNFDMFKEKVEQKNKNITEILLDILNEMSSAVNSFWNFQIVEGEATDGGDIVITIIDENWVGQNPNSDPIAFKHSGIGSPFLNSSLDVSIPADMANKIIGERLGNTSQTDVASIAVRDAEGGKPATLFNAKPDLFLSRTSNTGTDTSEEDAPAEEPAKESDGDFFNRLVKIVESNVSKTTTQDGADGVKTTAEFNKDGQLLRTIVQNADGTKSVTYETKGLSTIFNDSARDQFRTLETSVATSAASEAAGRMTSNIEKIDVVPNYGLFKIEKLEAGSIRNDIKKSFFVHCLDDTDFFEKMKNYYFESKSGTTLSPPLPIKYSFTILGNSGIRRGDTFNINGIPKKYKNSGLFQVTEVEHSISNMRWETTVTGQYRQTQ
jgi:hypothetical protein